MDPDTVDATARTEGEGLPLTGSSSGTKGKIRDSEQTETASPSLSSFKETKSDKQNHVFSTFFTVAMPARQPATAECGLAQHSPPHTSPHSLLPSLTESLSSTHSARTEPGTRTHTNTDTHPRAAGEKRRSPAGTYLGGRRQLPGTAQSEQPRFLTGAPRSVAARGEAQSSRATGAFPPPPPSPASSAPHRRHQPLTAPRPAQGRAWEM